MKTKTPFDADRADQRRLKGGLDLLKSAKSASIAFCLAVSLAACQTTAGDKPTPAEITARVCPPLEATISVLQYSPAISDGAKEEIARGAPLVHSLCAPDSVADVVGLADLADRTLPMLMRAVSESTMKDQDKQNLLLAIALLQIAVNTVKYP